MTDTIVAYTSASNSDDAARELCERITAQMPGAPPDALVLFASPQYDQPALLLRSDDIIFAAGVGRGIGTDRQRAAQELVGAFHDTVIPTHPYRSALIMTFDREAPLPFFLHNVLGIDTGSGHRLRVPLSVGADGSVTCASEIPVGAKVHIMATDVDSTVEAARRATESAIAALGGKKPRVALFFDCVATRLRMGEAFSHELDALGELLGPAVTYLGCNTHGQIARAEGQFGGFHNCTAVVCLLPE